MTFRLWRQDGQYWHKGNALTLVLWAVSLGAHLGYDALIAGHAGLSGLGGPTTFLYFAVSLAVQRWFLAIRASRIRRNDGSSGSVPAEPCDDQHLRRSTRPPMGAEG